MRATLSLVDIFNTNIVVQGGQNTAFLNGIIGQSTQGRLSDITLNVGNSDSVVGFYSAANNLLIDSMSILVGDAFSNAKDAELVGGTVDISNARIVDISNQGSVVGISHNNSGGFAGQRISISDSTISVARSGIGIERTGTTAGPLRISNVDIQSATSIAAGTGSREAETYISDTLVTGTITGNPICSAVFDSDTSLQFGSDCSAPPSPL